MKPFLSKKILSLLTAFWLINVPLARSSSDSHIWNLELKDFDNKSRTFGIDLYRGHSVNIILIPSEMTAKVAWLDDLSHVGLSFDGVLCEKWLNESCTADSGSASVIHLNLHKDIYSICYLPADDPLALNAVEKAKCDIASHSDDLSTSLTLLVEGNGKKKVLVFELFPKLNEIAPHDRVRKIYINPDSKPIFLPGSKELQNPKQIIEEKRNIN